MTWSRLAGVAAGVVAIVLPGPATAADPGAQAASTPRPSTKHYGGVQARQAGGTDEPVIATFKTARCNRFGGGFGAVAKSANGSYRLTVDISAEAWRGYSHHYTLFRKAGQFESQVRVTAPGDTVYDSTVAVPGGTGGGGITFTRKGDAISIGGVFFLEGDTEVGIAVSGAMNCTYRKKHKN